jgi:hypothetical protein
LKPLVQDKIKKQTLFTWTALTYPGTEYFLKYFNTQNRTLILVLFVWFMMLHQLSRLWQTKWALVGWWSLKPVVVYKNTGIQQNIEAWVKIDGRYQCFREIQSPSALKMETACFSETLVSTHESTWCHNSEQQHWHLQHSKNLKSQKPKSYLYIFKKWTY